MTIKPQKPLFDPDTYCLTQTFASEISPFWWDCITKTPQFRSPGEALIIDSRAVSDQDQEVCQGVCSFLET